MVDQPAGTAPQIAPTQPAAGGKDVKGNPASTTPQVYEIDGVKLSVADLKKQLDLAKGAQRAMQDSDRAKKDAANLINALKADPAATLTAMVKQGVYTLEEAKAIAKNLYAKTVYEPSTKTKEQLEVEKLKAEHAELLSEKKAREKATADQQAKINALKSKQTVTNKLSTAFKENPTIPETPDTIRFAAKHWKIAKDNGTPIDYSTAVKRGWNEIKELSRRIGKSRPAEEDIIDYYGEEEAERINKAWLKRLNVKQAAKEAKASEKNSTIVPNEPPKREDKGLSRRERQQAAIKDAVNKIVGGNGGR